MAEFIGARISLISNSDIRYVGTLHEINSETSTVALENVSMLGTEGRRPDNEVSPLDSVYEYILFRGSDVKDLRVEEPPAVKETKPPQIPHDPAILGSRSRQTPQFPPRGQVASQGLQGLPQTAPPYGQHPQYPAFYPPPAVWGRAGPPGLGAFPSMPYAGPPGWHPGSQQEFPLGPQFLPYGYPPAPPSQFSTHQNYQGSKPLQNNSIKNKHVGSPALPLVRQSEKHLETKIVPQVTEMPAAQVQNAPTALATSKSSPGEAKILTLSTKMSESVTASNKPKITIPRSKPSSRIQPALPLPSVSTKKNPPPSSKSTTSNDPTDSTTNLRSTAVTAAMAKFPPIGSNGNSSSHVVNPAEKLNGSTTGEPVRNSRQTSRTSHGAGKSTRGGSKAASRGAVSKVDVPKEDFDFETANAKFSKQDLVKEAIAGSPLGEKAPDNALNDTIKPASYNRAKSFFDNISSEAKDRQDSGNIRPGGREWRGEEQKRNLETFGQESIDTSYRGGHRGRGRGGYRGRGYSGKRQTTREGEVRRGRSEAQVPMH